MNFPSSHSRGSLPDIFLMVIIGLAVGVSLPAATYLPAKWMFFIIFSLVAISLFLIIRERERLLLYLCVVLTGVYLGFHPIFIQTPLFVWPISGLRITIFEVAFFFLFICWLIRLFMDPGLKVRLYPWITIPFLFIWLLSLAGLSRAAMPGVIKFSNLWLLFESWLIFLYFANNIRDRQLMYNIVIVLVAAGVLQSILGLGQFVTGGTLGLQIFGETKSYNVWGAGIEAVSRVSGTFGHPNNLAGYLVMIALINLALFWARISPRVKLVLFPALLLISAALILTYSRGGWLALGFGGMLTLFLCFARRLRHGFISLFLAMTLVMIFFVSSVTLITPLRDRLFKEDYGAARVRFPLAVVALNIINHHPWLGVGLGNYVFAAPAYDISREGVAYEFPRPVHNEFLLIAAEQGLPALALFLVILGYIINQLLRQARTGDDPILPFVAIGLLGTYFAWCIFRLTDYNYVLLGDPFWLLAGLSMALVRLNGKEPDLAAAAGQAPHSSQ